MANRGDESVKDRKRNNIDVFFFTSLKAKAGSIFQCQMTCTLVSKCLTSPSVRSGVLETTNCGEGSVMCSHLRTSIAAILVSSDGVDMEASTSHEYYVVKYAQLEASRISWRC